MLTNDVDLKRQLRQICRRQSYTFSVNASVGLLLQNSSTNQIAYYTAYNTAESNTSHVYVEPIKVLSPAAIDEVLAKFGIPELTAHATRAPQSSSWSVLRVTNLVLFLTHGSMIMDWPSNNETGDDDDDDDDDDAPGANPVRKYTFTKKARPGANPVRKYTFTKKARFGSDDGVGTSCRTLIKADGCGRYLCVFYAIAWRRLMLSLAQETPKERGKQDDNVTFFSFFISMCVHYYSWVLFCVVYYFSPSFGSTTS